MSDEAISGFWHFRNALDDASVSSSFLCTAAHDVHCWSDIRLGGFEGTVNAKLFDISAESLKVVVGAMLGALSMAARQEWDASNKPEEVEPDDSGDG